MSGASYWYSVWGDGYRVGSEQWDDADTKNGDGCDYQCNVEIGYKCAGGSSLNSDVWTPICGDGRRIGSEKWDDNNLTPGDGWSSTWTVESHWTCSGGSGILTLFYLIYILLIISLYKRQQKILAHQYEEMDYLLHLLKNVMIETH